MGFIFKFDSLWREVERASRRLIDRPFCRTHTHTHRHTQASNNNQRRIFSVPLGVSSIITDVVVFFVCFFLNGKFYDNYIESYLKRR